MRNLFFLIVLGGLGYFGWQTWQKHPEYFAKLLPNQSESAAASDKSIALVPEPVVPTATASEPVKPKEFVSRIAVAADAGEHPTMPPGQFLVLERASVETETGVIAIVPGDHVKLLERRKDGMLKVTNGQCDFIVLETQLTQDILLAQQAERRDFEKRYGRIQ